jgi:ferredoxin
MSWTVAADRERCIGSGSCVVYAPGSFTQDDEAKVVVLEPIEDPIDTVRVAVEACPTRALTLTEPGG